MKRFIYGQPLLCEMPMHKFLVDLTVNVVYISTLLKNHTSCKMKKVFVVESKLLNTIIWIIIFWFSSNMNMLRYHICVFREKNVSIVFVYLES
jgi:hypothetical protein